MSKRVILSDVVDIISGGTPKTSVDEYWNGDIGWLSISDFNNDCRKVYTSEKSITQKGLDESNTKILNKNDLIISARGTVGALAQIGNPMAFNQSCFGLRGKQNVIDNTYLYYVLKNYVANIQKKGQGSVFNTINLDSFKLMEIDIENDLSSQQTISSILSSLDDKIELNNKINDNLEHQTKALYDYWFVQNADKKWEVKTIDNIGNIVGGSTPSKKVKDHFTDNGIPWITPKDLSLNVGKKFIKRGEIDITEKGKSSASLNILPRGTVLMSSRAPIGYLAISRNDVTTNQGFKSFIPKLYFTTEFVYYTIQYHLPTIERNANGSTFKEISTSTLKTISTVIPPKDIVIQFTNLVEPIFARQELLEEENQQLSTLRDWLLPMLMNGQVKVE